MRTAILVFLVILGACQSEMIPTDLEADLSYYPHFFISGGDFKGVIVLDASAGSQDRQTAAELLTHFDIDESYLRYYPEYSDLRDNDAIMIGSCSQDPQNRFINIYADCLSMKENQAIVRIIDHHGAWLLYVVGYDEEATRRAVQVLMDHEHYELKGQDIEVVPEEGGYRIGEPT